MLMGSSISAIIRAFLKLQNCIKVIKSLKLQQSIMVFSVVSHQAVLMATEYPLAWLTFSLHIWELCCSLVRLYHLVSDCRLTCARARTHTHTIYTHAVRKPWYFTSVPSFTCSLNLGVSVSPVSSLHLCCLKLVESYEE